jgi:hypothetical protein
MLNNFSIKPNCPTLTKTTKIYILLSTAGRKDLITTFYD